MTGAIGYRSDISGHSTVSASTKESRLTEEKHRTTTLGFGYRMGL